MNPASWLPLAAGSEFTEPRDHLLADLCTATSREIDGQQIGRTTTNKEVGRILSGNAALTPVNVHFRLPFSGSLSLSSPQYESEKLEKIQTKNGLKGSKLSSLNAPGTESPQFHPNWKLQEFPFSHY